MAHYSRLALKGQTNKTTAATGLYPVPLNSFSYPWSPNMLTRSIAGRQANHIIGSKPNTANGDAVFNFPTENGSIAQIIMAPFGSTTMTAISETATAGTVTVSGKLATYDGFSGLSFSAHKGAPMYIQSAANPLNNGWGVLESSTATSVTVWKKGAVTDATATAHTLGGKLRAKIDDQAQLYFTVETACHIDTEKRYFYSSAVGFQNVTVNIPENGDTNITFDVKNFSGVESGSDTVTEANTDNVASITNALAGHDFTTEFEGSPADIVSSTNLAFDGALSLVKPQNAKTETIVGNMAPSLVVTSNITLMDTDNTLEGLAENNTQTYFVCYATNPNDATKHICFSGIGKLSTYPGNTDQNSLTNGDLTLLTTHYGFSIVE